MRNNQKTKKINTPLLSPRTKTEYVCIYSTTYGYWRYWVKHILAEGGISKFRFIKEVNSYNGKIAVAISEKEKAKVILDGYKEAHPEEKEMWQ